MDNLSRAEKRALRLAYDIGRGDPAFPNINASQRRSRESTLEGLRIKGLLIFSPHRGSTYHLTDGAVQIGKQLYDTSVAGQGEVK